MPPVASASCDTIVRAARGFAHRRHPLCEEQRSATRRMPAVCGWSIAQSIHPDARLTLSVHPDPPGSETARVLGSQPVLALGVRARPQRARRRDRQRDRLRARGAGRDRADRHGPGAPRPRARCIRRRGGRASITELIETTARAVPAYRDFELALQQLVPHRRSAPGLDGRGSGPGMGRASQQRHRRDLQPDHDRPRLGAALRRRRSHALGSSAAPPRSHSISKARIATSAHAHSPRVGFVVRADGLRRRTEASPSIASASYSAITARSQSRFPRPARARRTTTRSACTRV